LREAPVGFADVVAQVVDSSASATLLLGPEGIGKAMAVQVVVERLAASYDRRWLDKSGVDQVREVGRFLSVGSVSGRKVVGIDVDGASEAAQQALLKILEEPPRGARFVLSSSGSALPTVRSRCEIVVCPPLTFDQVVEVLVAQHQWTVIAARTAAALSGGRVSVALAWGDVTTTRMQVLGAVKALGTGDRDVWGRAVREWTPACSELFKVWAVERITGRWSVFTDRDAFGIPVGVARDVLVRLSAGRARARVAIHGLDSMVKGSAGWGSRAITTA
jgi:hypothetical protein